ncbi:MAG: response regulator [Balneolaceae bacterium]|nr:MAG: response regulator [Balneolaceae bacterium]
MMKTCVLLYEDRIATLQHIYIDEYLLFRDGSGRTHSYSGTTEKPKSERFRIDRPRLLHIEDNIQIRLLLHIYLKEYFDVDSVETGEEALTAISREKYDLVIIDINLGSGIDGFETAKKIRELDRYHQTPLIALTSNDFENVREDCVISTMNAYIQKPFSKPSLLKAIDEIGRYIKMPETKPEH